MLRRHFKAVTLLFILLLSIYSLTVNIQSARADSGQAKVYIVCLDGVDGWTFTEQSFNPARTKEGAIAALNFRDWSRIPYAHPKFGKAPPFYSVSYYTVTTWSGYKYIVESEEDVIIINTHGEIIPIPSGYPKEDWVDKIAEGMLYRKITWVHTAGYPFRWYWPQEANNKIEWGPAGFQQLMQHVNLYNVECSPPGPELEHIRINTQVEDSFGMAWMSSPYFFTAHWGRPLNGSIFKNYTILPIWGTLDGYLTGAAIAFVKPSERLMPNGRYGCGVYVHIGTNETFNVDDEPTGGDYWRGYVGAAAAIWTQLQAFKPTTLTKGCDLGYGEYSEWGAAVTPIIEWYEYDKDREFLTVTVKFGVFAAVKTNHSGGGGEGIGKVAFGMSSSPDCSFSMSTRKSKNGYRYDKTTVHVDWVDVGKTVIGTILWIGGGVATGGLKTVISVVGGAMVFSDWLELLPTWTKTPHDKGVDEWADSVYFEYDPENYYEELGNNTSYDEFQSIIHVDVKIDMRNRKQWNIIPLDWYIRVRNLPNDDLRIYFSGDLSIAVFRDYDNPRLSYRATVFYEDFEDDVADWNMGDANDLAGRDYWGISDYGIDGYHTESHRIWCARIGNNSVYNERPNHIAYKHYGRIEPRYDKEMNAYLTRSIDLKPYRSATLRYHADYSIKSGDYLVVEYWKASGWIVAANYTGRGGGRYYEHVLPTDAKTLRFRFYSNDDDVCVGAFLDNIEIIAELPNDANTMEDAGPTPKDALPLTFTGQANFAGYLNSDVDCYNFTITQSDIDNHKEIQVNMHSPQNSKFVVELYDPAGNKKAGPSTDILHKLTGLDEAGSWTIKIYAVYGFGQYDFDIRVQVPAGGCPTLFVWNGTSYVEEGILDIHAESDITIQHEITQNLAPKNGLYMLQLRELDNFTSHIDYVKLYVIDNKGKWHLCPLVYAYHSELGKVTWKLRFDDSKRVDLKPTEIIDLKFLPSISYGETACFMFEINGYNKKQP